MKKNWKNNHQKKWKRSRKRKKERCQARTKTWWQESYKKAQRTIKHRTIEQQNSMGEKWKKKLKTRLHLYESLVKSILLYNCGTWELSQSDLKNWAVSIENSWGEWLASNDPTELQTRNFTKSPKQSHYQ